MQGRTLREMAIGDQEQQDQALRLRVRAGDPEAYQDIFHRYSKPVLSFIYAMIGDRSNAEELLQETFIRAYQRLDSARVTGRFSSWLFGIARNVVREAIKAKYRDRRKVSLGDPEFEALEDARAGQNESVIAAELRRVIRRALADLPESRRVVFVLKIVNQMSYEEISSATGTSIAKLKTDLHRARLELRRKLAPFLSGRNPAIRGGL